MATGTSGGTSSSGSEDGSSALAQLSSIFPDLEYEFIESVLVNHGGSVEPAVHYLVAVLGDSDLPVSEDIGGAPQILADDSGSEPASPTGSVCVDIGEEGSSESDSDRADDSTVAECKEPLPLYSDVAEDVSCPPPSYDSLHPVPDSLHPVPSSLHPVPSSTHTGTERTRSPRAAQSLTHKIRSRRHRKKGYHSHNI